MHLIFFQLHKITFVETSSFEGSAHKEGYFCGDEKKSGVLGVFGCVIVFLSVFFCFPYKTRYQKESRSAVVIYHTKALAIMIQTP